MTWRIIFDNDKKMFCTKRMGCDVLYLYIPSSCIALEAFIRPLIRPPVISIKPLMPMCRT